ncbi:hypothetical protein QVG61_02480 [Thiohalobacter sp. IOR34]|uniref:hypothetical protein n=1 Tax=Thiohalobacter sp. IOR34 TaxID=3057176 RepID=UPI0025AF5226|nr:hypothetical protein [Thiohalobacter sp. IOR34]WJW75976.1 hypothetical protein QVG61_02480 [Thiohalobacter sp. IOR34]
MMMHTVYIHIDEELDARQLDAIGRKLSRLSHVTDVEVNEKEPHDLLVEYEPHEGLPMGILSQLSSMGLHADVMSS